MPAGQTPHTVTLYAHHDIVDSIQPGDRCVMCCMYVLYTCACMCSVCICKVYRVNNGTYESNTKILVSHYNLLSKADTNLQIYESPL